MYYFLIQENKVVGIGQCPCESQGHICIEVTQEQYELAQEKGFNYFLYEDGEIILNPDYDSIKLAEAKLNKSNENTTKAKEAISDGYVVYKEAKFETDTTTCSDLTSTSIIMQTSGIETWEWVTKDDKVLTLRLEDFANIGALIAQYKNAVWNVKYVGYKTQIEEAETIEEVEAIVIDYDVPELNSTGEASDTSSNPPVYTEETTDTEEITGTEETIGIEEITGTEETISIEEITGTEEATNSEKNIE